MGYMGDPYLGEKQGRLHWWSWVWGAQGWERVGAAV